MDFLPHPGNRSVWFPNLGFSVFFKLVLNTFLDVKELQKALINVAVIKLLKHFPFYWFFYIIIQKHLRVVLIK